MVASSRWWLVVALVGASAWRGVRSGLVYVVALVVARGVALRSWRRIRRRRRRHRGVAWRVVGASSRRSRSSCVVVVVVVACSW
ncbi:hypothetical protein ACXZ9C_11360 [Streptococcus agalactiae]